MDIIRYILFAQVFIAFFVAGGVFFKDRNLRNTTLAMLIALVGFHILLFLYGSGDLGQLYPEFRSWFYYEVAMLFGPLLFIHIQCIIQNKKQFRLLDVLHLLPIFIFWIGYGDVLMMEGIVRNQYISDNFAARTMTWNYFLAFQMIIYAIGCSLYLYFKRSALSNRHFQYALFLVVSYVCSTILIFYLTYYAEGWRDFAFYYLMLTLLIFGTGYLLFKNPDFLKQIRKKYFGSNLSQKDLLRIKIKIEEAFKNDKLFLDSNLSIKSLGKHLNEKPHHVSQTLSVSMLENFNDYVNKHRIEIAKQYLLDSKYHNFKIEAIALECGFNNKVTFYKAFTKFTNQTPSVYRKQENSKKS